VRVVPACPARPNPERAAARVVPACPVRPSVVSPCCVSEGPASASSAAPELAAAPPATTLAAAPLATAMPHAAGRGRGGIGPPCRPWPPRPVFSHFGRLHAAEPSAPSSGPQSAKSAARGTAASRRWSTAGQRRRLLLADSSLGKSGRAQ
jgi:hypothetical protein